MVEEVPRSSSFAPLGPLVLWPVAGGGEWSPGVLCPRLQVILGVHESPEGVHPGEDDREDAQRRSDQIQLHEGPNHGFQRRWVHAIL